MRFTPRLIWIALAWFLLELILAVTLADWYVQLLIDQTHRL